ncbi:AsmA family protein [Devosia honganensis]|uniref:AsmA family protein n=1 Tax=Devosia honganensis TaxID=1610527 RepID=A0ABV7WXL9_9HYPH
MLNRIYIVVGLFAILVLAAAFIVPRFVQWGDHRDRMEALATGVLGAEVSIRGDIGFSLLPTPRLEFTDVIVGDAESPVASVAAVEAEFALMDFLRDNYTITDLTLLRPVLDLVIDENGLFSSGVDIAGAGSAVALGHARIEGGGIRLTDLRADERFTASGITGDLRLSSFTGPFQFQGVAEYDDARYEVRFNSGAADALGNSRVSSYLREASGSFSVTAEGMLAAGMAPKFDGTLLFRQSPPAAARADDIRGDLVLESAIAVSTDRVVVSGYTLHPDENRAGMRLTGTASIQLGARRSFDAVVSGGVFTLPPRDATEVAAELPYEFVRLLAEIPPPPLPPMPGRLGVDLAEMGMRGFSLREVRLEATTEGTDWRIAQAVARLPGDTELRFSGTVTNEAGHVGLRGDLSMRATRLDALAQLWRRQGEDNPLFNVPGALEGRLMLAGDAFGLGNGRLVFAGQTHGVELRLGFGEEPRLDTVLQLGRLDPAQTAALLALLPEPVGDSRFGVSFPDGSFAVTAQSVDVLGLAAADLVAEAQWSPSAIRFSRLATTDWGGVGLGSTMRFSGNPADPRVTGSGQLAIASPDAPGLAVLHEMLGVPFGWQEALAGAWPADLQFILADAEEGPGQVLTLGGSLAGAAFDFRAEMDEGLRKLAEADLRLVASLEADDQQDLLARFGLGAEALFSGGQPLVASLFFEGSGPDGFDGRLALGQGEQSASYFGRIAMAANGELSGEGTLDIVTAEGSSLAALAGVRGASLPGFDASAALRFEGARSLSLSDISGVAGRTGFGGDIAMQRLGPLPGFSGTLRLDSLDLAGLAAAVFGAEALVGAGDGAWPEGPLALASQPRSSRGDIAVTAASVTANGTDILGRTGFTFSWSPQSIGLDRLEAEVGGGVLGLNLVQCCAGALAERSLSGRATLSGVDLDAIVPAPIAAGLDGRIDAGLQFEGTGQSLAEVMRAMTGEGNFTLAGFAARGLSPGVFPAIAGFGDVLDTEAEALETLIALALGRGEFAAPEARGAFTIAGGMARLANLIVEGEGGRLAGSLNLALDRLGLDGGFVLTPRGYADPDGLVEPDTARILTRIGGTLPAPEVRLDLGEMVAAIQVRANELEVERLEVLRREDEERQRAAAEERNRLIEEQRRRAAAEEEARRLEEERQRQEELQQQQSEEPPPLLGPLDLGFQPGVAPAPPLQLLPLD